MNTVVDKADDVGRLVEDAARKVLQLHGSAETLKARGRVLVRKIVGRFDLRRPYSGTRTGRPR